MTPVTIRPESPYYWQPEASNRIMSRKLVLHPDRLFPPDPGVRSLARALYATVRELPIISPHGHTDPTWFAGNEPFGNATELLLAPEHFLIRTLASQGVPLASLGVASRRGPSDADPREAWRLFASRFHLFQGTPSWLWLNHVFTEVFGIDVVLEEATADRHFDEIGAALQTPAFRPRALFERFNIEVLATTESPVDSLEHHRRIRESELRGRVITTYRSDAVVDPEHELFRAALDQAVDRSSRYRHAPADHPLHPGRDGLQPRAGAARRPLSGSQARPRLVVPRQPGRDAVLPRADHRDCRVLQHRGFQRRHAGVSLH